MAIEIISCTDDTTIVSGLTRIFADVHKETTLIDTSPLNIFYRHVITCTTLKGHMFLRLTLSDSEGVLGLEGCGIVGQNDNNLYSMAGSNTDYMCDYMVVANYGVILRFSKYGIYSHSDTSGKQFEFLVTKNNKNDTTVICTQKNNGQYSGTKSSLEKRVYMFSENPDDDIGVDNSGIILPDMNLDMNVVCVPFTRIDGMYTPNALWKLSGLNQYTFTEQLMLGVHICGGNGRWLVNDN